MILGHDAYIFRDRFALFCQAIHIFRGGTTVFPGGVVVPGHGKHLLRDEVYIFAHRIIMFRQANDHLLHATDIFRHAVVIFRERNH